MQIWTKNVHLVMKVSVPNLTRLDHTNKQEKQDLTELRKQFFDIVEKSVDGLYFTSKTKRIIRTTGEEPYSKTK